MCQTAVCQVKSLKRAGTYLQAASRARHGDGIVADEIIAKDGFRAALKAHTCKAMAKDASVGHLELRGPRRQHVEAVARLGALYVDVGEGHNAASHQAHSVVQLKINLQVVGVEKKGEDGVGAEVSASRECAVQLGG